MEILVGFTTTQKERIPQFLQQIRDYGLTRLALFPTALNGPERENLYRGLEDSPVTSIPHVHLRTDMGERELDYLSERFGTEVFNIHSLRSSHPYLPESGRYAQQLFIENSGVIPGREELDRFGGLCIDFSHWENGVLSGDLDYRGFEELARAYKVGCCHVSAIRKSPDSPWGGYDDHSFRDLGEFRYLSKYRDFLPRWISLELENLPEEQLLVKASLEKMLEPSRDAC